MQQKKELHLSLVSAQLTKHSVKLNAASSVSKTVQYRLQCEEDFMNKSKIQQTSFTMIYLN